jgi:hypothetical protein
VGLMGMSMMLIGYVSAAAAAGHQVLSTPGYSHTARAIGYVRWEVRSRFQLLVSLCRSIATPDLNMASTQTYIPDGNVYP